MTHSAFTASARRVFLCYGAVRDHVLPPGTIPLPLDGFLHRHLRVLGHTCILYYSHRGLYFYDHASRDRAMNPDRVTSAPSPPSPLAAAPGGLTLRRRPAPAPMPAPAHAPLVYPNLNRLTEMLPTLRRLFAPGQPDVAVIFDTDHLSDFASGGAAVEQWRGFLEQELRSLPVSSRSLLIFLFGMELAQLADHLRTKPALNLLLHLGSDQHLSGIATPLHLGAPERDEIARLVQLYRLRHGLQVDWRDLAQIVLKLTAAAKTGSFGTATPLRELETRLQQLATQRQPLNATAVRVLTGAALTTQSAADRLAALRGLVAVKAYLHRQCKTAALRQPVTAPVKTELQRLAAPLPPRKPAGDGLHLVLAGNPGTGKTTVARLIGELYQEAGLLELGHTVKVSRADLVGGYVGQTALKTRERIAEALDGVLFIDEAYSLVTGGENDFGREALTELVEAMSNYQERLCVIFAGYPQDMERLLAANAGLTRRVTRLELPDYTAPELAEIFEHCCRRATPPVVCAADLTAQLPQLFTEIYDQRPPDFGNAGTVETLFAALHRAALDEQEAPATPLELALRHLPPEGHAYLAQSAAREQGGTLAELDALIGLTEVKRWIHDHLALLRFEQQRGQQRDLRAGHYLFVGNPGTGKTTVARLMAAQFKQLGLLKTARFTEVTSSELAGQPYLGQTEQKVRDTVTKALGGVLFIDEAHQLAQPHGYGHNVLNTLTPLLTNHADELMVILAGYSEQMTALFDHDPGLKRRFERITFADFSAEELSAVFMHTAQQQGFTCAMEVTPPLTALFAWLLAHKTPGFGNAGAAQHVFAHARRNLVRRFGDQPAVDPNQLTAADLPAPSDCEDLL